MIINKDGFYKLISWSKRQNNNVNKLFMYNTGNSNPYFKMFDWSDQDYWFIEFLHGDAFSYFNIEELMSQDTFAKIITGEVKLVLCNSQEAYHSCVDEIYKYLIVDKKIAPTNIFYMTNSFDIQKEIDHVAKLYGLESMNCLIMSEFEFKAKEALKWIKHLDPDNNKIAVNSLYKLTYNKKFVCLNGFDRPHRVAIVSLMFINNLIDKGYVSFSTNNRGVGSCTGEYYYNRMVNWFTESSLIGKIIRQNKDKLMLLSPIYLDTCKETQRTMALYTDQKSEFYENSYFSVITETLCMVNESHDGLTGLGRTFSEKTFKPIVNKHPFILLGVPGTLNLLKSFGYKTWEPFIDESYDLEKDDSTRILKIYNEIEKLVNLNPKELEEFIEFAKPITLHNYNNLFKNRQEFVFRSINV